MTEHKRKKKDDIFNIFGFEDNVLFGKEFEPAKSEGGSGYSMSVTYDEEGKPVVKVKTYGDVDVAELRQDIQKTLSRSQSRGIGERTTD